MVELIAALVAVTAVTAFTLTGAVLWLAKKGALLDVPNYRSAHTVPTPRGGGIAFVIVITAALTALLAAGYYSLELMLPLIVCSLAIAILGLWDDISNLSAKFRLLLQFCISIAFILALPVIPLLNVGGYFLPVELCAPFYVVVMVWLTNLYNFMDGIDGIAISQALTGAAIAMLILVVSGNSYWILAFACIFGSSLGFLPWNWPSAKIFMGDVGSSYLGFIFACLMLLSAGEIGIWTWFIILGLFIADTCVTLSVRVLAKQNVFDAHQSHIYQQLARYLDSHQKVCYWLLLVSAVWLLPLALIASSFNANAWLICILAYLPMLYIALKYSTRYYNIALVFWK
ncbi:MAG: Fuc2NAc and GlcNAc transferase [Porticoccus sp.]|jgi:Fuc2NAc and GlcNAc transferase